MQRAILSYARIALQRYRETTRVANEAMESYQVTKEELVECLKGHATVRHYVSKEFVSDEEVRNDVLRDFAKLLMEDRDCTVDNNRAFASISVYEVSVPLSWS